MTPLVRPAVHSTPQHHEVLKKLLIDVKAVDLPYTGSGSMQGATALFFAALVGNYQAVESLLLAGANPYIPRKDGMTPLWAALQGGRECIHMWLIY